MNLRLFSAGSCNADRPIYPYNDEIDKDSPVPYTVEETNRLDAEKAEWIECYNEVCQRV
jgi:hypothetical protein